MIGRQANFLMVMAEASPLEISVSETREKLTAAGTERPRLIDVRDPDEFAYCQLPNAELVPLATVPVDAAGKLPDKAAEIIVYCHHGMRSMQAVGQLRALGYTNARSMAGGIDRWSREVDPGVPRY